VDVASVQLVAIKVLSPEVASTLPANLDEALRSAFGQDNAVVIKNAKADYVLGGSVQRVGDKDHYAMRLQGAQDGATLWTFDMDTLAGAPIGPRRVAWATSAILRCGLSRIGEYPKHLPAHTVGLYISHCGNTGSIERGIDLAHRVIAEAPDFSRAWSALATDEVISSWGAPTPAQASELKRQAAKDNAKALDLDDRNGEAYITQAVLAPPGRFMEQEAAYRRAIAARPSDCGCEHANYGSFLFSVGRIGDANRQWERTLDMQPQEAGVQSRLVISYLIANDLPRSAEMLTRFDTVMAGEPQWVGTHRLVAILQRRWTDAAKFLSPPTPPDRAAALLAAFDALRAQNPLKMAAATTALEAQVKAHGGRDEITDLLMALGARAAALTSLETQVATNPDLCVAANAPQFCKMLR